MIQNKTTLFGFLIIALSLFSCQDKTSKPETSGKREIKTEVHERPNTISKKRIKEAIINSNVENNKENKTEKDTLYYICYSNNTIKSQKIWISFDEKNQAVEIKYKGQTDTMKLKFDKEAYIEGGTHPTIIKYYNEIYKGTINGQYKLTHSGNWDYVTYLRAEDGKEYNFTIDHNSDPYGSKPCF